jgi:hypothetical protein
VRVCNSTVARLDARHPAARDRSPWWSSEPPRKKQSKTLKKLTDGGKTLVFYEQGRLRG